MTYYAYQHDIARLHPMEKLEDRHNGMALFAEVNNPCIHVLCNVADVFEVPDQYYGLIARHT